MKKREFLKTTGAALSGAAITSMAAINSRAETGEAAVAQVGEREWARALARHVADQLPEAIRQLPGLSLSPEQIQELRRAYENTLIINMGCVRPPSD